MSAALPVQKLPRRKEWFALRQFPDRNVPGHYLNEARVIAVNAQQVSTRLVDALSIPSPFFDILWPSIFEVSDQELQDTLHSTASYFKNMWERADARRKSQLARTQYAALTMPGDRTSTYPTELRLCSPQSKLWYSWSAEGVDFGTTVKFTEFCIIAGRNGSTAGASSLHPFNNNFVFISPRRDITLRVLQDTYDPHYGYVGNISCTGERQVALELEEWFIENIYACREMFRGWRQVDSAGIPF